MKGNKRHETIVTLYVPILWYATGSMLIRNQFLFELFAMLGKSLFNDRTSKFHNFFYVFHSTWDVLKAKFIETESEKDIEDSIGAIKLSAFCNFSCCSRRDFHCKLYPWMKRERKKIQSYDFECNLIVWLSIVLKLVEQSNDLQKIFFHTY